MRQSVPTNYSMMNLDSVFVATSFLCVMPSIMQTSTIKEGVGAVEFFDNFEVGCFRLRRAGETFLRYGDVRDFVVLRSFVLTVRLEA